MARWAALTLEQLILFYGFGIEERAYYNVGTILSKPLIYYIKNNH